MLLIKHASPCANLLRKVSINDLECACDVIAFVVASNYTN
jgi:hypothetical protein